MKKILTVLLTLLIFSVCSAQSVSAQEDNAQTHTAHCVCGTTDCTENHEDTGSVNWQSWDGDLTVGKGDGSSVAVYLHLEDDLTITDTLTVTDRDVYLCLNGKTLTIDKEGYPAVRVGSNGKFVLCDCRGTGKITGAKGSAESDTTRFAAINCQSGNFVMYGGSIADNEVAKSNGGGVFVSGGSFTMHGGSLVNNKAPNGSGGAISAENGTITVDGGEMIGNSALNGGAVHLKNKTKADLSNVKLSKNSATGSNKTGLGGAIFAETRDNLTIRDVEIAENSAMHGGGICVAGFDDNNSYPFFYTNIYNADIHDNTARGNGGGIYLNGNYMSNQFTNMYNCSVHDNSAEWNGGGYYAKSEAQLQLSGGSITGNTCKGGGGGIRLDKDSYFNIRSSEETVFVTGNTANLGGGISASGRHLTVNGQCEIKGNTALQAGGGMYIDYIYTWLILTKTTVTENTAPTGGGICLNKKNTEGRELEIGGGTTVFGNTLTDGTKSNLYLMNGKKFQLRSGLTGSEKIGVSASSVPTVENPLGIEYVFESQYHDKGGDRSALLIPDDEKYTVLYENEMHYLVPKYHTVTLDLQNGEESQTVKVEHGGTLDRESLPVPTWDGYSFDTWYLNGAAYNFEKPINDNLTLTARWIKIGETALSVDGDTVLVFGLDRSAVLIVASYGENGLLNIAKIELDKTEKAFFSLTDLGINTENATEVKAFLWDNADGSPFAFLRPLCESAAADFSGR